MSAYAHNTTPVNYELAGVGISGESGLNDNPFPKGNNENEGLAQLKRGGKRIGNSFDTGLHGENNSRFLLVTADIKNGVCNPSVRQIMKRYKAKYEYARDVLAELAKQGVLIRDEQTGQYTLIPSNGVTHV